VSSEGYTKERIFQLTSSPVGATSGTVSDFGLLSGLLFEGLSFGVGCLLLLEDGLEVGALCEIETSTSDRYEMSALQETVPRLQIALPPCLF